MGAADCREPSAAVLTFLGKLGTGSMSREIGKRQLRVMVRSVSATKFRLDALWTGLLFLAVYELLRQQTLYGDGGALVQAVGRDVVDAPRGVHLLYLPLMHQLRSWFAGLGISDYDLASHLSCVATAVGVAASHLAFVISGFSRRDALVGAALVGLAPGVMFFATVVEYHGLAFGASALAFVPAAMLMVRPGIAAALLLGVACGIAYLVHASGAFLPLPLLALAWLAPAPAARPGWARAAVLSVAAVAAHAALVWGVPSLLRASETTEAVTLENAQGFVLHFFGRRDADLLGSLSIAGQTVWNEWLWSMLPVSWVALAACLRTGVRAPALGLTVALVPYFGVCFLMLGGVDEHGAYFLPLTWPAAWITLRALPRLGLPLVLVGALAAVGQVVAHDQPERGRAFAAGLRDYLGDDAVLLLIGSTADQEACIVQLPDQVQYASLEEYARTGNVRPETVDMGHLDASLDIWFEQGSRILLTADAEDLANRPGFPGRHVMGDTVLPHLRATYRLEPVVREGFRGVELHRK